MNRNVLKRLEKAEQEVIPKDLNVVVFIEESDTNGIFNLQENIYRKNRVDVRKEKIKASNAQEIAANYVPPDGCKEPLIISYDYGV